MADSSNVQTWMSITQRVRSLVRYLLNFASWMIFAEDVSWSKGCSSVSQAGKNRWVTHGTVSSPDQRARNSDTCSLHSKMNEKTTASRKLNESFRENRNIEETQSQAASSSKLSRREKLQGKYPKIYPNPSIENGYELRNEENLKGKLRWQRFRTKLFYRIGRIKWSIRIEVTRNIHWNVSVG